MNVTDTSLFKNVKNETLKLIEHNVRVKQCSGKFVIVREESDDSPRFYIVKSGIVVISKTDTSGAEISLSLKKKGDPFGLFSIIDDKPRNGKAVTLCSSEYWTFNNSFIQSVLLKDINFSSNLLKCYAQYIRDANDFHTSSFYGGAQKKLLFQLLRIGEKKVGSNSMIIHHGVNQAVMSSFAGITRETVSREIKKLKINSILKINQQNQLELNVELANTMLEAG